MNDAAKSSESGVNCAGEVEPQAPAAQTPSAQNPSAQTPRVTAPGARQGRGGLPGRWRSLLPLLGVFVAVALGIVFTNGGSLGTAPIDYYEDSLFQYGVASSANEAGLTATHPRLNAPLGADWRDFAIHTDLASVTQYWLLSFVSDSPVQIVNMAYVLSYFLCAAAFYLVATRLGARVSVAAGLAIGYPFTAYHFFRGIHHQFMSQYWTLPLLVWIAAVVAFGERQRFASDSGAAPSGWRARFASNTRRGIGAEPLLLLLAGFLCAINGAYYTVFAVFLLAFAVVTRALRVRPALSFRHWRLPAWPLVGFGIGAVTAILPSALLRMSDGINPRTPSRMMSDGDQFALRPSLLFAPIEDHRLGLLREWAANLARSVGGGERQPMAIGLFGTAGVILALLVVLRRRRADGLPRSRAARHRIELDVQPLVAVSTLAVGFLVISLLVGVPGGLHWDISMAGFKLIRSWGRTSILIATLAMLVLALGLSWLADWRRPRSVAAPGEFRAERALAGVAVAALLGSTMIWDQGADRRTDPGQIADYRSAKHFYETLESALPVGTSVFYLPTVPFPEHWMGSLLYNPLEGVFFTKDLKFSSGGIAGRQSDWQENLVEGPEELFAELKDAGFGAAVVDRRGFGDPQWFVDQYSNAPGVTVVAEDEHRVGLDILGVREPEVRTGFDLVHQPTVAFVDGFNKPVDGYFASSSDDQGHLQSFTHSGVIEFRNRTDSTYKACVRYEVEATTAPPDGGERRVNLDAPGRAADRRFELSVGEPVREAVLVELPPGITDWNFAVSGEAGEPSAGRRSSAAVRGFSMVGSFGRAPDCAASNG